MEETRFGRKGRRGNYNWESSILEALRYCLYGSWQLEIVGGERWATLVLYLVQRHYVPPIWSTKIPSSSVNILIGKAR